MVVAAAVAVVAAWWTGDVFERDGALDLLASEDDLLVPAHKDSDITAAAVVVATAVGAVGRHFLFVFYGDVRDIGGVRGSVRAVLSCLSIVRSEVVGGTVLSCVGREGKRGRERHRGYYVCC